MKKTKQATGAKRKSPVPRKRFDKSLDQHWALLSKKDLKRPGAPLLALLLREAHARGIAPRELAQRHLGLSYTHFMSLRKGHRPITRLGDETIDKISRFLGRPKVVVMLAAGTLKLADFYQNPEILDQSVEAALQFIHSDPEQELPMPLSAFGADVGLRRYIVRLYEKATGKILLPTRASLMDIVQTFQAIENLDDLATPNPTESSESTKSSGSPGPPDSPDTSEPPIATSAA